MSEKIDRTHLERAAYVYVRQSTMTQVRENRQSQRRQYQLAERARELGFHEVVVVDDDLGVTASGSRERAGFGRLLAAVCEGAVGAVLALEASRLARNNRDWHHLVDLCALTNTVLIDQDGIYDPKRLNDRLLLGLKGTMSEFELGLLRQRAQEALRQMVGRGEVLTEVPVGYVRTPDNGCEMSPDRQVQEAIRGVFSKFRELGSARQVLLWHHHEQLPLPRVKPASSGGEVDWKLPAYHSVLGILKNPTDAGAFVYGRRRTQSRMVDGRMRKTAGHERPREEWAVLIRDHHPGYISWQQYLDNQEQLRNNRAMKGLMHPGAAKRGKALPAGLLRCARCGRKLHVQYCGPSGRIVRYSCRGGNLNHGKTLCISFAGRRVDEAVAHTVLQAVAPAGAEAAVEAWHQEAQAGREKLRSLELAVEKARYEVERARRQYDLVEPENRLVAAELEGRWEEAIRRHRELEARLREEEDGVERLGEDERERLLELGADLDALWHHPQASARLKKRIVRCVLEEIVVDIQEAPPRVLLTLHWAGGVHTALEVRKNRPGRHRRCTDRAVVELVAELVKVCDDQAITALLNRLGYRTGAGNTWTESRVRGLRSHHGIPAFDRSEGRAWLTAQETAARLGISKASVRRLLKDETLPGRQVIPGAPWVIESESLTLPGVKAAVQAILKGRRPPPCALKQVELPLSSTT